jgi:O-methyltransferase involved in polyketide biosynthesis
MPDSGFDPSVAHPARIYDYWLGGKDNYDADRLAGDQVLRSLPVLVAGARANRAFLGRAVRFLADEAGVEQFLDIGSGLPTAANTHEVAQAITPAARVAYVDNDVIVTQHARALLTRSPGTAFIRADLREPELIIEQAASLLDLSRPVALMLLLVLHLIPDSDAPDKLVSRLMSAVAPGSALVISHPASDIMPEQVAAGRRDFNRLSSVPMTSRSRAQVARFFEGMTLVEPGLVQPQQWRLPYDPDSGAPIPAWCGVALKP